MLDDPKFMEKYGAYIKGLRQRGYLYEPLSMSVRLLFAIIPILMSDQGN
jgi:hypothetical protein